MELCMHNVEMAPGELLDTEKGPLSKHGEPGAVNTKTFMVTARAIASIEYYR
jgi:hypothetical protein